MTSPLDTLVIRAANAGEWNRIRSDWKRSHLASAWAGAVGREAYWPWQSEVVDRLLVDADVRVAVWSEDNYTIAGWSCSELPRTLHYVYVLDEYRRAGIAKRLLAHLETPLLYTHRTTVVAELPIPTTWTFDPRSAFARKAA